jgi:leucine dehydrogenase
LTSEHAQAIITRDADADYTSVIALHSTERGPAIGGTRLMAYASVDDAIADTDACA